MKIKNLFLTSSLFILLFFIGKPAFSQRVFPYKTKGLWGLMDENQKVILKPVFFKIEEMLPYKEMIFFSDSTNAKGISDFKNNVRLKPDAQYRSFKVIASDFIEVKNIEDKVAVYDYTKKEFLSEFSFQKIIRFLNDSLLLVSNDDYNYKGVYNINQKRIMLEAIYRDIEYVMKEHVGGSSRCEEYFKVKKSDKVALYNIRNNTFVTDFLFEDINGLFPDNTINVSNGNKRTLYGLDVKKFLSDSLFGYIQYLSDYIYVVESKKGQNGVYDFKKNKYLISGQKYIQPLYETEDKTTQYIINSKNKGRGVYSLTLDKQIIPQEYDWIRTERVEKIDDKTKKKSSILLFVCTMGRYNPYNVVYFDESGNLVSQDLLVKEGIEIGEGNGPGIGSANGYDEMEEVRGHKKSGVTIKKSGSRKYKIVLDKYPKDTFRVSGYDTIIKLSSLRDKPVYYRSYTDESGDTILLGIKANKYQLISYKGKVVYPLKFDSLQLFQYRLSGEKIFLYCKDKKFGIINLGTKPYVSEALFTAVSWVEEYSLGYPYFIGYIGTSDATVIDIRKGIIYHPEIKLELLKKSN